ncbi:MAG: acetamidase/formamidase family protein [Planctomycetota bacterium]|jgi:acetamidase/formamidase|nr:acetamidase/formamidase family protein [Planctomycetota bacterium]
MHTLPLGELCYEFSRHNEPRLHIQPGKQVMVETEDAFSGQIRTPDDRRDKAVMPFSNPVNGPITVEGAEPGDSLAVRIDAIHPSLGQCATYTGNPKQMCEWLGIDVVSNDHVCPIRDGLIYWSDQITIPYEPMLGCIGTAPDWGVPTTGPAGPHGGNMDLVETCPGNTVYLPVTVPGAYLYLGDAHAAMGDGELSASGLEMPSETTITVDLIKDKKLAAPRIESDDELISIASGSPMERAIAEAYARLILWLEEDYDWDRWKAYDLLTHVGKISIGYYQSGSVGAKVAKNYL